MDKNKSNNILYFTIAVIVFALIGTGLLLVSKRSVSVPDPVLSGKYKFSGAISVRSLDFNNSEINKLNRCVFENRNTVDNVSVIVNQDGNAKNNSSNAIKQETILKYMVILESKSGMKFSQEAKKCSRQKLVSEILFSFNDGAEALETYSANPALKGKVIQIVDI